MTERDDDPETRHDPHEPLHRDDDRTYNAGRDRSWEDRYREHWAWDETAKVTHPQDCYPGNCSFTLYKKDGEIFREEQTGEYPVVDPSTPDWNPRGCNKGCLYSRVTEGDERITRPMKQVGGRGSGEWEPISWADAYEEIADAIIDAVLDNPQSIVFEPPIEGGVFQSMAPLLLFGNALGGTVLDEVAEISDASLGMYATFGKFHAASTQDEWFKADLNLVWHMNPVYTRIPAYHFLTENRYDGGELVTIAPDYSPSCVHADQYVPVESGSDAALALGMCRHVVAADLVDREFVREQTDLPLLVREDTDRFLRASHVPDGTADRDDRFYVWDADEGLRRAPTDTLDLDAAGIDPALEGRYEVRVDDGDGGTESVTVRPVFERLRERLAEYDPASVREITGVHPEVVRDLARRAATGKTNVLVGFNTCKTFHGDLIERSMALLLALTGNWGEPGTGMRSWCVVPEPGLIHGTGGEGGFADLARTLLDGDATEEQVAIKGSMLESRFGFPTVPPAFYWYRHAGFDETWAETDWESAGIPRAASEYVDEALERDWWTNLDRPAPDADPRVLFAMGNNTLRRTRGGTRNLLESVWPDLDLAVTVDVRWSTTALYSDIVLPAAFFYEKEQFHMLTSAENRFWSYAEQAIDPVGESRPEFDIVTQLARTVAERAAERGLDTYEVPHGMTPAKIEDVVGRQLPLPDGLQQIAGRERRFADLPDVVTAGGEYDEEHVEQALRDIVAKCREEGMFDDDETLDDIRDRGFVKYEGLGSSPDGLNMATCVEDDETVTPFADHVADGKPYPTLTKRAQFYVDHEWFIEADEALPRHKPAPEQGGDYDYRLDSGHQRWSIHASTATNEQMAQTHRAEPFVFVNEADAAAEGVSDGDYVRVFNDYGSFVVQAKLTALTEPGQLIIYHAWDPHQYEGWRSYDHLLPGLVKPLHFAGGYGHLSYWSGNWQPQQIDRHVNVDFEPVADPRETDSRTEGER